MKYFLFCLSFLVFFCVSFSHKINYIEFKIVKDGSASSETSYEKKLWKNVIPGYLEAPLWNQRDIYDAGHYLMIPLHAAFIFENSEWQKQFHDHFSRFLLAYPHEIENGTRQRLNRLQYFYLLSRYLVLAQGSLGRDEQQLHSLSIILFDEVQRLWKKDSAWQWGQSPFAGGIRERVLWKLKTRNVKLSYYRAIIDEELFLFAITADLVRFFHAQGKPIPPVLVEIFDVTRKVFENEVVWNINGGWLFQPGVWTDHPDYAYAGRHAKKQNIAPLPLANVAWDSSHSHRFPLWLTSLKMACSTTSDRLFYQKLKTALEKQLVDKVLVSPTDQFASWRMTNFMDGRNGLYRWRPRRNTGYGPFELSGTLLLGWWVFLDSESISSIYNDISQLFPLSIDMTSVYIGPATNRTRNPLVTLPAQYNNGLIELIVRLATKISPDE